MTQYIFCMYIICLNIIFYFFVLFSGDTKPVNKKQWKLFDGDLDNATYSNYIADVVQLSNE